ncbi:MAG: hypothetical protein H7296_05855 [Bacteroidia bacterium]|nr:hypothetical protein [Bacteroidia bacterium]
MKIKLIFRIFTFMLAVGFISCSHYLELQKNPNESSSEGKSHNAGEDCGSCHNKNGSEAANNAWWTVAGTVYRSDGSIQKNAVIEFWEKPGKKGALIKTLITDSDGNFYTNQIINYNNGCSPAVNVGLKSKSMDTTTFNGVSCNSCHGLNRSRITLD